MKTVKIKASDIKHDGTVYFMGKRVSKGNYNYFVMDGDRVVGMEADAYPEPVVEKPKAPSKRKPKTQKDS